MKKITILISTLLLGLMVLLSGCSEKKPDEATAEGTTAPQVVTEEVSTTETDPEEDVTPEYVDDYTVELKEDEVIEIN